MIPPATRLRACAPRTLLTALVIAAVIPAAAVVAGCRPTGVAQPLTDTDPVFVIPAIKQAAGDSEPGQLDELVSLLENEDAAIRIYAVHALRDRTGEHFDYEPWADESERAPAVARWRTHVDGIAAQ